MFESAGGDASLWLSNLFGGSANGAGLPGQAGPVGSGFMSGGLGLSPGDAGVGNVSDKQLSDALGGLGKATGGAGAATGGGDKPMMPGAGPAGQLGKGGGGGVSLMALVQLLAKRRDELMQSATGGVGAGQAPAGQRTQGLLGL